MSDLKEKLAEYIPVLRKRLKAEKDPDKQNALRIKITEIKRLKDDL